MTLAQDLDRLLDRTVVLGYGNLGLQVRRRLPDWPPDPPRLDGRVALVTGAGSGIGLATCRGLARLGARVHAVGRDPGRADEAVRQIRAAVPEADAHPVVCDVSDLTQIRGLAERITAETPRLDVLVNNAGVMPDQRERSPQGHELMFATHVLAPFALTGLLAPFMARTAPGRIINVSSGGMYGQSLPGDDLESERTSYGPKKVYARTKREQVVITEQWAQRLAGDGVVVHAMHPGWADTKGVRNWLPVFRALTRPIIRTPEQGADTIVWLAGAPEAVAVTGRFWHDRRQRPTHYRLGAGPDTEADRQALWRRCAEVTGVRSAATASPAI